MSSLAKLRINNEEDGTRAIVGNKSHRPKRNSAISASQKTKKEIETECMTKKCWWCTHPSSDGVMMELPFKRDEIGEMEKLGQFCGFPCMIAYNMSVNKNTAEVWEVNTFIREMAEGKGYDAGSIRPAPPKEVLLEYGGKYTIEEYRESCGPDGTPVTHYTLPMAPIDSSVNTFVRSKK